MYILCHIIYLSIITSYCTTNVFLYVQFNIYNLRTTTDIKMMKKKKMKKKKK